MSDGSVVFMYATDSDWKSDFLTLPRMEESRNGHVTARIFGVGGTELSIKSELYSTSTRVVRNVWNSDLKGNRMLKSNFI
jgi:hypothetical protein